MLKEIWTQLMKVYMVTGDKNYLAVLEILHSHGHSKIKQKDSTNTT
jgi:hypothetical protein